MSLLRSFDFIKVEVDTHFYIGYYLHHNQFIQFHILMQVTICYIRVTICLGGTKKKVLQSFGILKCYNI